MASPIKPGGNTSEDQKVLHRRIEDENIIEEIYKIGDIIGQGSFGVVVEAENLKTKERFAIKKVNKEKAGSTGVTLLEREVAILKRVKHSHIIRLEEIFETSQKMFLVMELCEIGELKDLLFKEGPFSEVSCRYIVKDLSDAIVYLHKNGIVHRDLKLENILIAGCEFTETQDPLYDIRLTDFGLSVVKGGSGSESLLHTACGTPVYMAPEVIKNHDYSEQCDQWSVGVILYVLLSCRFPFIADTEDQLFETIKRAEVGFTGSEWESKSNSAKSLIKNLLVIDPARRYTAREVASHYWVTGNEKVIASKPPNVLALMKNFAKFSNNDENGDEFSDELLTMDDSATSLKRPGSNTTLIEPLENLSVTSKAKLATSAVSMNPTRQSNLRKNTVSVVASETSQPFSLTKLQTAKKNVPLHSGLRKTVDSKSSIQSLPGSRYQPQSARSRVKKDQ